MRDRYVSKEKLIRRKVRLGDGQSCCSKHSIPCIICQRFESCNAGVAPSMFPVLNQRCRYRARGSLDTHMRYARMSEHKAGRRKRECCAQSSKLLILSGEGRS